MGNYVLNWTLLVCSMGKYFWCSMGNEWVHIVVVVNNIPNVKPAVIYMPFKSTLTHEFDVWFLHGRLDRIEDFVMHSQEFGLAGACGMLLALRRFDEDEARFGRA